MFISLFSFSKLCSFSSSLCFLFEGRARSRSGKFTAGRYGSLQAANKTSKTCAYADDGWQVEASY